MTVDGFVDRSGNVLIWCDRDSGTLYDQNGTAIGFVSYNGVFDLRQKRQFGWWYGDHIRDLQGRLFLVLRRVKATGVAIPFRKSVFKPRSRQRPTRSNGRLNWAGRMPPPRRNMWTPSGNLFRLLICTCGSRDNPPKNSKKKPACYASANPAAERIYAWASERVAEMVAHNKRPNFYSRRVICNGEPTSSVDKRRQWQSESAGPKLDSDG